jgi:NHLM bacteriocin system ABC transporter peptidase/ATP-binding protein
MTVETKASPPQPETSPNGAAHRHAKRVRTPTVLQMEAVECGAAALGIILGYYGKFVPLEELRVAAGVSRDGSRASNILQAARSYGLIARGYQKEINELEAMPLPVIVFWNFNHFLVIEGFGKHRVYINDPNTGPRTVTYQELNDAYCGVVLAFEPGPDFKKGGARSHFLAELPHYLRGSERALLFVILATLTLILPGLLVPVFSKIFVDDYLVRGHREWIVPLLLGMGLTAVLRAGSTWLQQAYLLRLQAKLSLSMSSRFLWHVLRLPVEFYNQRFAGGIAMRVAINDRVAELLSGDLATAVLNSVTVVFYAAIMFALDPLLTAVGILMALLNVVALRIVSRKRIDTNRRLMLENVKVAGTSMAGLQMIETLKATGSESDFFSRWAGNYARLVNAEQELAIPTQYLTAVPPLLTALNTAVILALGGVRVMEGDLTVGTLVAFQTLMVSFTAPFNQLVNLGSTLQEVHADIERLDDVLHAQLDPQVEDALPAATPEGDGATGRRGDGATGKLVGYLELRGVVFGYSRLDPPLLDGFSLKLSPGSRVAIVGATGSGKSTVARLVCGLYTPWEGDVLLDGTPRAAIPRRVVTQSLAQVDQEIFLFEGTVRDNLCMWDRTIPEARIVQAAKDACIHDDVAARPGGYESHVEEGGANFSGGQRQRLEIARALALDPTLMVLDEATSALDPLTEKAVDDHLRRRGCTCLIIAHRLSTIRDCDEILVLEGGKVVQRGTHEELASVPGPYATLIEVRAREEE